jgi:hypothetical protein
MFGAGSLALSLCVLAGCGTSNSSAANDSLVSQEAATATASEATAIATSMTETQAETTSGAMLAKPESMSDSIKSCATVDVTSTGSDGQWTAETLTFAAPPCQFTGARGYVTLDVTGQLALTRTTGDPFNFTSTATNMEWAFMGPNATYSETRNGTRQITASPSAASAASNMTIVYAGSKHDGTLVHAMTSSFTPDSGLTLQAGEPLPSGTFVHNGTATWTGVDGNTGTFTVTTTTPLAYDSTCKDTEPSVFDSGQLQIQKTTDKGSKYATVTWSDCGAPTITYVDSE